MEQALGKDGLGTNRLPTARGARSRSNGGPWDIEALATELLRRDRTLKPAEQAWSAFVKRLRRLLVEHNLLRQAGGTDEPVKMDEPAAAKSGGGLSLTGGKQPSGFRQWLDSLTPGAAAFSMDDPAGLSYYTRLGELLGPGRAAQFVRFLTGGSAAALSTDGLPGAAAGGMSEARAAEIVAEQLRGYGDDVVRRKGAAPGGKDAGRPDRG